MRALLSLTHLRRSAPQRDDLLAATGALLQSARQWQPWCRGHRQQGTEASLPPTGAKEPETPLLGSLKNRMLVRGGPLSVAEYMQEVLTNPGKGFYMQRDVFGAGGDFVTSPEISQMFGEMVGIWCVVAWMHLGSPERLRLVELGPGRGTLMADLLRGTAAFADFARALEIHLVEISPALRKKQWTTLKCVLSPSDVVSAAHCDAATQPPASDSGMSAMAQRPVTWHASLDAVPGTDATAATVPTLYLAHEFFDALPVHQFVRDPARGWLEKMVDVQDVHDDDGAAAPPRLLTPHGQPAPRASEDAANGGDLHLRMVLSPRSTPATAMLVPRRLRALGEPGDGLSAIEIGAHAMATAEQLAIRVSKHGGGALIIDYGQDAPYADSLTAIRGHGGVHPLSQPGSADLSAWVDFSALRQAATESGAEVDVHGPVEQGHLLHALGIQARLQALCEGATQAQAEALLAGYQRLTDSTAMGTAYKALAIMQRGLNPPVGFEPGQEGSKAGTQTEEG